MSKVMPTVDLKKLYVAVLKKDDMTGVEYDLPVYLEGINEIGIKPKENQDDFYAEGILWLSEKTLADIGVEIDITDLAKENEALILGHKLSQEGGIIKSADDVAPEVAILFEAVRAGGKGSKFVILYRGTFAVGDESYQGKQGKTKFQTKKLKATFAPLHKDKMWSYSINESDVMTADEFFADVIIPTPRAEVHVSQESGEGQGA